MKIKIEEECRGCVELVEFYRPPYNIVCRSGLLPNFNKNNEEAKCPCGTCLLKGICEISCGNYRNYHRLFHGPPPNTLTRKDI